MTDEYKITISVDDLHPEKGWGIEGDESMTYLETLNKDFGAKFTLFIPSNYHRQFPLSNHKDWIKWLLSKPYFELCAHGHYHMCEHKNIGEQEFLELDYANAKNRLRLLFEEWRNVEHTPVGFKMPGWGCNQESANAVSEIFSYVAAHERINQNIHFKTKVFYGQDGIHLNESINVKENNIIMFQSHISGNWNDNVWNNKNFYNIYQILEFIKINYKTSFITLKEL